MTIEVSICNKDDHKSIEVTTVEYDRDRGHAKYISPPVEIKPHNTMTWHVHLLRDLQIREVKP